MLLRCGHIWRGRLFHENFLEGVELTKLQFVSRQWLWDHSIVSQCKRWLHELDHIHDLDGWNDGQIFHSFFCSRAQRQFLSQILATNKGHAPKVAIAGSFAVHNFTEDVERASDIDIFYEDEDENCCRRLWLLYEEIVAIPLRLKVHRQATPVYYENNSVVQNISRENLLQCIQEHVKDTRRASVSAYGSLSPVMCEEVEKLSLHVPKTFSPRKYLVRDVSLWVLCTNANTLLRNLNVIRVSCAHSLHDVSFAQTICQGFDLEHCKVSLEVSPDFKYQYTFFDDARTCVDSRKLQLSPHSFLGSSMENAVNTEIVRLLKYMLRGYAWR